MYARLEEDLENLKILALEKISSTKEVQGLISARNPLVWLTSEDLK